LFDADGTKRMQSQYPLLSMEAVRIGGGSHDETNLAVKDVSFEVWAGEKVILLGPSGCGKSTLLKAIAGFIRPDGGVISFAGREDWRTVMDNVAYPLRVMGGAGMKVKRRRDGI